MKQNQTNQPTAAEQNPQQQAPQETIPAIEITATNATAINRINALRVNALTLIGNFETGLLFRQPQDPQAPQSTFTNSQAPQP